MKRPVFNRNRYQQPAQLPAWLAIILIVISIWGCTSKPSSSESADQEDVVSTLIAEASARSLRALAEPSPGDPGVTRDLVLLEQFREGRYNISQRQATADSFFATWDRQPSHLMWPEFYIRGRRHLRSASSDEWVREFTSQLDTTVATGRFAAGWMHFSRGFSLRQFRLAKESLADSGGFPELWVGLKLAYLERIWNNPQESLEFTIASLPEARKWGGQRLEADVWTEASRALFAQGRYEDALAAASTADTLIATVRRPNDPIANLLAVRILKARILAALRDPDASLALHDQIIAAASERGLAYLAARSQNLAAILALEVNRPNVSLDYARMCLHTARSDRDSLNTPKHLLNLARRFRIQGELDSCLVYMQEAEHWVEAYPNPSIVARMPLTFAEYYAEIGAFDIVDSLLTAAAAQQASENSDEARAELHLELIRGWMESGRPDLVYRSIQAIEDLRNGTVDLAADRHVVADLNLRIGEFLCRRGEYRAAEEAFNLTGAALQTRPSPFRSWELSRGQGVLARKRGDLDGAIAAFQDCERQGASLGRPALLSDARFLLGSALLAARRFEEARAVFPTTDRATYTGRFVTRVSAILFKGISYSREGRFEEALALYAAAKAACRKRSPVDLIARIDLETGIAKTGLGRFEEAEALYQGIADRLTLEPWTIASPELAHFTGSLRRSLVEAYVGLPNVSPASSLDFSRRILPSWQGTESVPGINRTSLQIVFFVGRDLSCRWLVSQGNVSVRLLPGREALQQAITPVISDMAKPGRDLDTRAVGELSNTLLGGLEAAWAPEKTLSIVPDLDLFRVPWSALQLPGSNNLVLEHGPIAICDSPLAKTTQPAIHHSSGQLLSIGSDSGGIYENGAFDSLRHAEEEARSVAAIWPQGQAQTRTGREAAQALTANTSLAEFEAVHVASHAVVYDGLNDKTVLLLGGAIGEAIPANVVRELKLDAKIVFLSCCEAGDGAGSGAEYAGLARNFLHAGAHNVIAPLIRVDDAASSALAVAFYRYWLEGQEPAVALWHAQKELRKARQDWQHPFYWAFHQAVSL